MARPLSAKAEAIAASAASPQEPRGVRLDSLCRLVLAAVCAGVLANLIFSLAATKPEDFARLSQVVPGFLVLAAGLSFVPWLTHAWRLRLWTRFLGYDLGTAGLLKTVVANDLGAAVSPTAVGGGAAKAALLIRQGVPAGTAVSIVALGSLEDYCILMAAVPVALAAASTRDVPIAGRIAGVLSSPTTIAVVLLAAAAAGALYAVGRVRRRRGAAAPSGPAGRAPGRLQPFTERLAAAFRLVGRRGKLRFGACVLLSAAGWTCRHSAAIALIAGLGMDVEPLRFFLLQWLVYVAALFVPTPGAAVGAEAAFFVVYRSILPAGLAGTVTVCWRFVTFYLLNIVALVLFQVLPLAKSGPAHPAGSGTA